MEFELATRTLLTVNRHKRLALLAHLLSSFAFLRGFDFQMFTFLSKSDNDDTIVVAHQERIWDIIRYGLYKFNL